MAEIVGLAASIVQLGGAGVKLSIELHNFITSTARADKAVIDLAEDLDTTGSALDHVGSTLRARHMRALASPQAINVAAKIVRRCEIIFAEVQEIINKRRKFDKHRKEVLTLAGKLSWPLKEQKVELLRRRLDSLKLSLSLLLDVLKLAQGERQSDLASEMQQKRETIRDLHRQRKTAIQREIDLEAKIKNLELEQVAPSKADQVTSIYATNALDPNIASQVQQPPVFDVNMTATKTLSTYESSSSDSDIATTDDEDEHFTLEELDRCAQQVQRLLHCIENVQNGMSEGRVLKRHHKRRMYKSYQRFRRRFEQNFETNSKESYSQMTLIGGPQPSLAQYRDSFCTPKMSGLGSEQERIGPTMHEVVTQRDPKAAQTIHSSHNWRETRLGDTSAAGASALRPTRRLRKPGGACFPIEANRRDQTATVLRGVSRKSAFQPAPSSSNDVKEPTPLPYGTRSRKPTGRFLINYTEDADIDFETEDSASVKDDGSEHNHKSAQNKKPIPLLPTLRESQSNDQSGTTWSIEPIHPAEVYVPISPRLSMMLESGGPLGILRNPPGVEVSEHNHELAQDKKPNPLFPTLREPQSDDQSGIPSSTDFFGALQSKKSVVRRRRESSFLASTKHSVQASPIASPNTMPAVPAESRPVGAVTLSPSTAPIYPAPPSVPFIVESDPYGFNTPAMSLQGFQDDFHRDSIAAAVTPAHVSDDHTASLVPECGMDSNGFDLGVQQHVPALGNTQTAGFYFPTGMQPMMRKSKSCSRQQTSSVDFSINPAMMSSMSVPFNRMTTTTMDVPSLNAPFSMGDFTHEFNNVNPRKYSHSNVSIGSRSPGEQWMEARSLSWMEFRSLSSSEAGGVDVSAHNHHHSYDFSKSSDIVFNPAQSLHIRASSDLTTSNHSDVPRSAGSLGSFEEINFPMNSPGSENIPDFNQVGGQFDSVTQQYGKASYGPSELDVPWVQMVGNKSDHKIEEGPAGHNKRKIEVGCASESKRRKVLGSRLGLVSGEASVSKEWISLLEDPLSSTTQASTRDIVDMLLEQWTVPISV